MPRMPHVSRRCRRLMICRLLAFSLTSTLICLLFLSTKAASLPLTSGKHVSLETDTSSASAQAVLGTSSGHDHHLRSQDQAPIHEHTPVPLRTSAIEEHRALKPTKGDTKQNVDLLASMKELARMLADDMRTKALLDPLVATGEALLRDLAYRVRAFKTAFAVWESLHLLQGQRLRRQEDVMQQLNSLAMSAADRVDAVHTYDNFRYFINSFANRLFPWTTKYFGDHMTLHASFYNGGRGIVLTAGDDQAAYLLTTIPSFRKLGCHLPIEILYLGDDDLSEDYRDRLEALDNVITRDLTQMIDDEGWTLKGWAAKPYAILMSSFREVIFVDADALFFTNPALLFDDEQYRNTGALFFKDRNLSPESKKKWLKEILPHPISYHVKRNRLWTGESGHMQDSGVLVLDKWRHYVPLLLTTRLNGPDRDGDESKGKKGVYEMVYGDKETFWLSWELAADLDYAFHDGVAGTMGVLGRWKDPAKKKTSADDKDEDNKNEEQSDDDKETVCAAQLLHLDRDGKPLWFNGWIERHKFDEDKPFDAVPFDVYMMEPGETGRRRKTAPWDIKSDNIVCLKADDHFIFTEKEKEVLGMIQDLAKSRERV